MEQFANNAVSSLNGSISASATSLTVVSATPFPTQGNFRLRIDNEILLATAVAGPTFTVTRGAEGTTAAAHSNAASVTHILTASALSFLAPNAPPIDSFTLHQWLLNDPLGSTTNADTGTAGTTLTIQNPAQVNLGDVGFYCDTTNFVQNGSTGGWSVGPNDAGNPTSTTLLSMSAWVKPRTFTNQYPRIISKGFNPTFSSPFVSAEIVFNLATGQVAFQWDNGGSLAGQAFVSGATSRGFILLNQWQHIAVTFSQAAGSATISYYWNGTLAQQNTGISTGPIGWNSGSSGPWVVGGVIASAPINNSTFDGWIFDARVDDGIARSAAYWKNLYKLGLGLNY